MPVARVYPCSVWLSDRALARRSASAGTGLYTGYRTRWLIGHVPGSVILAYFADMTVRIYLPSVAGLSLRNCYRWSGREESGADSTRSYLLAPKVGVLCAYNTQAGNELSVCCHAPALSGCHPRSGH